MTYSVTNFLRAGINFVREPKEVNRERFHKVARETFRRIPEAEWEILRGKLSEVELTDKKIGALVSFDFGDDLFQEKDWPLFPIKAFIEKKISFPTYCCLMLYDACLEKEGFRIIGMEEIHQRRKELHLEGVELEADDMIFAFTNNHYEKEGVLGEIFLTPGQDHFGKDFLSRDRKEILIWPPHLYERKLQKCTDYPKKVRPVHGYSSPDDFFDPDVRDLFIPSRFVESPEIIHGETVEPLWIYIHDLNYHLHLECYNPHRDLWVELAGIFDKMEGSITKDELRSPLVRSLRNRVLDRNFRKYLLLMGRHTPQEICIAEIHNLLIATRVNSQVTQKLVATFHNSSLRVKHGIEKLYED